jgi:Cu(I)/Ag(I) efflux system periplasmic protein CusF
MRVLLFLIGLVTSAAGASSHDAATLFEGEVRRVDKDARKITLRHGPMPSLDMPAHTMVFQVSDPGMLNLVKPGDKVRFHAEKRGGAFTITEIRPVDQN